MLTVFGGVFSSKHIPREKLIEFRMFSFMFVDTEGEVSHTSGCVVPGESLIAAVTVANRWREANQS